MFVVFPEFVPLLHTPRFHIVLLCIKPKYHIYVFDIKRTCWRVSVPRVERTEESLSTLNAA